MRVSRFILAVVLAVFTLVAVASDKPSPSEPKVSHRQMKQAQQEYEAGQRQEQHGNWQQAYDLYSQALENWPGKNEYQMRQSLARFHLVQGYVTLAERDAASGELEAARQEFKMALALDPTYAVAAERLEQIDQMLAHQPGISARPVPPLPQIQPAAGVRSFDYRGDTEGAYQEIARQFAVSAAFDPDLPHHQIRFQVKNVDFPTAVRLLGEVSGTFWRPLGPRMFFVAANTQSKVQQFAPSIVRNVVLPASATTTDMEETTRIVRDIAELTRTQLDTGTHTLTLRGTPDKVALATELIHEIEQPRGEILLEMDILEVDRNFSRQLGITPPTSAQIYTVSPAEIQQAQQSLEGLIGVITQVFGQPSSIAGLQTGQIQSLLGTGQLNASSLLPPLVAFGGGKTTFLSTLPGAVAQLSESLNLVRSGQQMVLRGEDGEPTTFFVGDRFPVSLASLSSSLSSSGLVPTVSSSSFPTSVYPTGMKPAAVAAGVFGSNGFTDLAIANENDNTVSILLNNGSGSFTAGQVIPVKSSPISIAVGDFNNDGKLDLAVANANSNTISILLGNGDGTFADVRDVPAGDNPVSVVTANFTSSGNLDLAVANQGGNTVSILLGDGDGTFQPQVQIPVGATPVALATGVFNATTNAFTDIAVVDQASNQVYILLGNGDGTFSPGAAYATGNLPTSIVTADFNGALYSNGTSIADLAVTNETDGTVSLLIGNGNGTFQTQLTYPAGTAPVAMVTADFNSDSFPDVAVVNQSGNAVSVLLNDGTGNLVLALSLPVGNSPDAIATGEFDTSGRPEVAVTNGSDNTVSVILNDVSLVSASAANSTPYPAVQYIDLGLKVTATPRIHPDGDITLKLNVEVHGLTAEDVNGIPVLSSRTLEQIVRLKEGQATVVGSLMEPQETLTLTGWPGLAELGGHDQQNQDTELVIVVRPRVIRLPEHIGQPVYAGVGSGTIVP